MKLTALSLTLLIASASFTASAQTKAPKANLLDQICSTKSAQDKELMITSLYLEGAKYSYEVNYDCNKKKVVHTVTDYTKNTKKDVTGSINWDSELEVLTFDAKKVVGKKNLYLVVKPAISEIEEGSENLGKKVVYGKEIGFPTDAMGYLSEITPNSKTLSSMKDLVSKYEASESNLTIDGQLDGISKESMAYLLNFAAPNHLFKAGFRVNNETIEDPIKFYKAQTVKYSEFFSALSK